MLRTTRLKYKSSFVFPTRRKAHIPFLDLRDEHRRSPMTNYHPSVQDYIRASESLLKTGELSDEEALLVEQMRDRISDELLNDGKPR
jgi:hypothetical protein